MFCFVRIWSLPPCSLHFWLIRSVWLLNSVSMWFRISSYPFLFKPSLDSWLSVVLYHIPGTCPYICHCILLLLTWFLFHTGHYYGNTYLKSTFKTLWNVADSLDLVMVSLLLSSLCRNFLVPLIEWNLSTLKLLVKGEPPPGKGWSDLRVPILFL